MSSQTPHRAGKAGPERYRFLDLYRGVIVLLMLEGHVLRALLTEGAQRSAWFGYHELLHGVIGPGFLFGAGFAFAITTQRRWDLLTALTPAFFRRVGRMVLLVAIGYALHLPYFSIRKTLQMSNPQEWSAFLSFDVLQCIGLTLLALWLLLVILRSEKMLIRSVVVLLLLVVYVTPFFWSRDLGDHLSLLTSQAINGLRGSPYPLFPNAGFLLAGTVISWQFLRQAQAGNERAFIKSLSILGFSLVAAGLLIDQLPFRTYPAYDFWYTSPNFFWIRLGLLCLLMSGLWLFESRVRHREGADFWMPHWLIILGVESFVVYVSHLILLYGWLINPLANLRSWWGLHLALGPAVAAFAGLTLIMIPLSQGWHFLKKRHPVLMKGIYWYLGLTFAYYFLTNPY
jgi:acyltransferase